VLCFFFKIRSTLSFIVISRCPTIKEPVFYLFFLFSAYLWVTIFFRWNSTSWYLSKYPEGRLRALLRMRITFLLCDRAKFCAKHFMLISLSACALCERLHDFFCSRASAKNVLSVMWTLLKNTSKNTSVIRTYLFQKGLPNRETFKIEFFSDAVMIMTWYLARGDFRA